MAMDVGGSKGGPKSDINVTPLVDVMLVLLIIMMLVAPMLQKGVDVKLPLAANTADKPDNDKQTVVAVDSANLSGHRAKAAFDQPEHCALRTAAGTLKAVAVDMKF